MRRSDLAVSIACVAAAACTGGASSPGSNPDVSTPLRLALHASATSASPGDPVELAWTVEGEAPILVTIDAEPYTPIPGNADVGDRASLRVNPLETTEYVLRARDGSGQVEARATVEVVPRLEPRVTVLAPGESQRFWVAGARGPYRWAAAQGTLEVSDLGPARWTAPTTPGTYELRVRPAGRDEIVQRLEVREKRAIAVPARGVLGQPDLEDTRDVVAGDDGTLWAIADEGLVLRREPEGRWTIANEGLDFVPARLAAASGGTIWAVGATWDGNDVSLALGRRDPIARRWVGERGPWESLSGAGHHLAVGANGTVVVGDASSRLWGRFPPSAAWWPLPDVPHGLLELVVAGDDLYARLSSSWGLEDLVRLEPRGAAWTVMVPPSVGTSGLGLDPAGRLVVRGQGVARLREDGSWEDLSEGLPSDGDDGLSTVEDLAFVGDRWVAVTDRGVFARQGDGGFSLLAPLPGQGGLRASLLATGDGEVLLVDGGIWRFPAGAAGFVPLDGDGSVARNLYPSAFAFGPDGAVAVAASDRMDDLPPAIHLRAAGSDRWAALATGAGTSAPIVRLFFGGDGALLAASERELLRIPTDGGPAAPLPTDGLPPDFRVVDFAVGADGTRFVVAQGRSGFFEVAADGDRWRERAPDVLVRDLALGPDGSLWLAGSGPAAGLHAFVLRPGAEEVEPVGVGPVHDRLETILAIEVTAEGTAWAMTHGGLLRLEDGAWRQVGSGRCSHALASWSVSSRGRAFCADEHHLYAYDETADDWVRFEGPLHVRGSFLADAPRAMGAAPDGGAWLGFRAGGVFEVVP